MSRREVLTIAVAVFVGAAGAIGVANLVAGRPAPSSESDAAAQTRIAELEREVAAFRERAGHPTLAARPDAPATPPRPTAVPVQPGRAPEAGSAIPEPVVATAPTPPRLADPDRTSLGWFSSLRGVVRPQDDHPAMREMWEALRGSDGRLARGALRVLESVDVSGLDRARWRSAAEPYVSGADAWVRSSATISAHRIDPRPTDLDTAIAGLRSDVLRGSGEKAVECLVRVADGVVEGAAADAMIDALRDGTTVKRCFLMRGLATGEFTRLDPRVVSRMVEIARGAPVGDYDSYYFFEFVARRLDPRPQGVIDLALEILARPEPLDDEAYVLVLAGGIADDARGPLVERLLDLASGSEARPAVRALRALAAHASSSDAVRRQVGRLRSIADDVTRPADVRELARRAAAVASPR